ncbi:diguanylate cyclase (GGDEF)-like protein [Sanguibacter antarcticus]|uniref:Diguanylate cyclase (GGDEF)-like protein n=1 Tax=Sanguibacter antarcticus TaxID=372484 RepID=A0A2A9E600_9MICO|nr:GGDEF domain-containing protein [Sanguibacter antarcticus]PFG34263.1 diguanylate cyclase (GGDEF)-like protein [Sanguibacter antarcticus]
MTASRPRGSGHRTTVAASVVTLVLCCAYALSDGVVRGSVSLASTVLPAVAVVVALRVRRLTAPLPWVVELGGLLCLVVVSVTWLVQVNIQGAPRSTGIVPLLFLPLGYLGFLIASVLVILPIARRDGGKIVDAGIGALAGAGLLWTFVVLPVLDERDATLQERTFTLLSLLLLCGVTGALARAIASAERARPTLAFLLVAALMSVVGHVSKVLTADPATGTAASWVGVLWITSYVAMGAALLHPTSEHLSDPGRVQSARLSVAHLLFLWAALSINPAVAIIGKLVGRTPDIVLQSTVALLIAPLIIARVWRIAQLYESARVDLVRQATHDALTGLPNRRAVATHLETIVRSVDSGTLSAARLFFLDLDGFKSINDVHGHTAGDHVLVEVARRLRGAVRRDDFVARMGGDEFLILIPEDCPELAAHTVTRIRDALADPVAVAGTTVIVEVSVGSVPVTRADGESVERLLSLADAQMYIDKRSGHPAS